jgi:hypothetical protein
MTTTSRFRDAALALAVLAGCADDADLVLRISRQKADTTCSIGGACRVDDESKCGLASGDRALVFENASGGNYREIGVHVGPGTGEVFFDVLTSSPNNCRRLIVDVERNDTVTVALPQEVVDVNAGMDLTIDCAGCRQEGCPDAGF